MTMLKSYLLFINYQQYNVHTLECFEVQILEHAEHWRDIIGVHKRTIGIAEYKLLKCPLIRNKNFSDTFKLINDREYEMSNKDLIESLGFNLLELCK